MVAYQPQFDLAAKRVSAFEALARWNSKELGVVNPNEFIRVAEASGLITQVTQILLRKAMVTLQEWPSDIALSFNLSAHDILDSAAVDEILNIVAQTPDIDPSRICFEITETAMMSNIEKAGLALQKLVDAGHAVAVDDFGTGYSNFIYLHKLPISKIKIDRSFVREFSKNKQSIKVLATLLQLTRSLNKECIIEGVETEIELAALQSMGVRTVQGYHCGRPMNAGAAAALIMHQNQSAPKKQHLK